MKLQSTLISFTKPTSFLRGRNTPTTPEGRIKLMSCVLLSADSKPLKLLLSSLEELTEGV